MNGPNKLEFRDERMRDTAPAEPDPVEGILAILREGSVTGTSKYFLLLALMDCVLEFGEASPRSSDPLSLTVSQLAESVLELQWEHTRPFGDCGSLNQVTVGNRQSTVLSTLEELFASTDVDDRTPPGVVRKFHPEEWALAVAKVGKDLARNPVQRLQRIAKSELRVLYDYDRGPVGRHWDGTLHLRSDAVAALARYGSVLRPIIEARISDLVTAINLKSAEISVAEHLFGNQRRMPPEPLRQVLTELQKGRCLWTGAEIARPSADHVVPWSRARLSLAENFVITNVRVNSQKANLLIGPRLTERWLQHLSAHAADIAQAASQSHYESNLHRAVSVAASLVRSAPLGTPLFDEKIITLTNDVRRDCLKSLQSMTNSDPLAASREI